MVRLYLVLWEATSAGDAIAGELIINGYTYTSLFGKKLIVTNKKEYVPRGTIYGFAAQEYLGNSYIMEDTKFWIDKKKNVITWSAYETIGMGIGNIKAVAKVTWTA